MRGLYTRRTESEPYDSHVSTHTIHAQERVTYEDFMMNVSSDLSVYNYRTLHEPFDSGLSNSSGVPAIRPFSANPSTPAQSHRSAGNPAETCIGSTSGAHQLYTWPLTYSSSRRFLHSPLRAVPSSGILEGLLLEHGGHAPKVLVYEILLPGVGFCLARLAAC